MLNTRKHMLAGILLVASQTAAARCEVVFSTPQVELGQAGVAQLLESDVPGFRQLGATRTGVLSVQCDTARTALRLRFSQLVARGNRLLRWSPSGSAGALQLRIAHATADGTPVLIDAAGQQAVATVDIERDNALVGLDLHSLPGGAKRFTLEVQMTGLVEEAFRPTGRTDFSVSPTVEVLDP